MDKERVQGGRMAEVKRSSITGITGRRANHKMEKPSSSSRIEREREFFSDWALNPVGDALRWKRELRGVLSAAGEGGLGDVLSVGCGRGEFELMLARHANQVTGIDLSPESIEHAQRLAAEQGVDNAHFECANADGFDLAATFDTVVCIGFLHHLTEPEGLRLLERIYRHMRPGGLLRTQDPNMHGVLRRVGRLVLGAGYDQYHTPDERELDPEDVRTLFLSAGFSEARIQYMDLTLIPGMQLLPSAPGFVMRGFDWIDRAWCSMPTPVARFASGFAVDAIR